MRPTAKQYAPSISMVVEPLPFVYDSEGRKKQEYDRRSWRTRRLSQTKKKLQEMILAYNLPVAS